MKSSVVGGDKGVLSIGKVDMELLTVGSGVVGDGENLSRSGSEGLLGVEGTDDLVEGVGIRIEEGSLTLLHIF